MEGRRAPPRARVLVLDALGLDRNDDKEIMTAFKARFSSLAVCSRSDMVLLRAGTCIWAARVMLHCTAGSDECVSVLQLFTLVRRVPNTYLTVWFGR